MPRRASDRRIDASKVQGEGAFVVMRALTYGESKQARQQGREADDEQNLALGEQLIISHIVDWNWVDDAGEGLPLPKSDPAVLHLLTVDEMNFISKALNGDPNAPSGS